MKEDLKITLVQSDLHWENIEANLAMFSDKLASISEPTDLVILPEMFSTGFTMNAVAFAENMSGKTLTWMANQAKRLNAVLTGSLIITENGKFYNRLVWMRPDGSYETYDKRHLFGLGKEDKTYTAGHKKLMVELKGWKICPMICYDLRFPVWIRNRNTNPYDLFILVANWPERRSGHWKALLPARAVENQCFVVGVNRVGNDGNDIPHTGDSMLLAPDGTLLYSKTHVEDIFTIELSKENLEFIRRGFPFLKDQDDFTV
ncbi:amidohydrolase [Solitalea koreensis]|uniref:Omega-amidase YafV n=1 Tax=Solitalea koreensis TaxID=543615 RepID=A0A521BCN5_9SPHI|nr:amidohydrolase [Solitalea koreensis]SMO44843.1 Predicted amidohydrolase [Solitalea koreensis]